MMAIPIEEPAPEFSHVTVMRDEVLELLQPRAAIYLDVTAGGGGHSAAVLEASPDARILAFDRDQSAVEAARCRLADFGDRARVEQASFVELSEWFEQHWVEYADGMPLMGVVADLGVSSPQLMNSVRGMSFRHDGPLDMRMDPTCGETALDVIERVSQDELANLIFQLGGERRSRRVARCIKQAYEADGLETTSDLRRAVVRAVGPRRVGGVDPATRTFQALRIAVNRELEQLEELLSFLPAWLALGGVAAIISFHSLEDRIVKRAFLSSENWERLTRKPRLSSVDEQAENPRSRSAKLRGARRIEGEVRPLVRGW